MNTNIPLASVIVVNWNGREFIFECIDSLLAQSWQSLEIIVVDNGSTDGSDIELVNRYASRIRLIKKDFNTGFAAGNNTGIREAKGEFIFLLNSDAVAEKNWIKNIVEAGERNPHSGMFASKILQYDNREIIDNTGHLIYRDGLNRGRGRLEKDFGQFDIESEIFFPSGCAACYRKKMLDDTGLFDEDFFAYGDDTDIGLKCRVAGWGCTYVPTAIAYHRYSGSSSAYSKLKAFHVERNRAWISVKYFPPLALAISPFYTLLRFSLQAYGALSGKGAAGKFRAEYSAFDLIIILLKAYASAINGLPKMLEKRKKIKNISKVSSKEFNRWLKEFTISAREIALKD
ncbi:MAG: glycosyltransferase family 2 protein [Candidatus Schekmanbacteria bacterium]|nr:glycosyltransferase family 2 protein [Candidatus Schekmanbacteria bacterium]